ncbi:hypothetical protein [Bacillus mycoides]|uniref:hypothetical protein n=1 Tax=Bacillus mycoides TaxID=1405 RepID=UPI003A7F642F
MIVMMFGSVVGAEYGVHIPNLLLGFGNVLARMLIISGLCAPFIRVAFDGGTRVFLQSVTFGVVMVSMGCLYLLIPDSWLGVLYSYTLGRVGLTIPLIALVLLIGVYTFIEDRRETA